MYNNFTPEKPEGYQDVLNNCYNYIDELINDEDFKQAYTSYNIYRVLTNRVKMPPAEWIGQNTGEITEYTNGFAEQQLSNYCSFNDVKPYLFKDTFYNYLTKQIKLYALYLLVHDGCNEIECII